MDGLMFVYADFCSATPFSNTLKKVIYMEPEFVMTESLLDHTHEGSNTKHNIWIGGNLVVILIKNLTKFTDICQIFFQEQKNATWKFY